ncbi:MAG: DUF1292 domain-containing protein [Peptoniphilaceae bacterium]|nr:DUF1292 domain-containing protein [Peptoniphilaceae bacterium]MDY6018668.1 DUF1292 domain-containing protein [Anaerococcus sp.]
MTQTIELHGHQLEFEKNKGKALIEFDFANSPQECYLIDIFSVDRDDYIALVSVDSEELYILRYDTSEDDKENINLIAIDNEEELDLVYHLFSHYWDEDKLDKIIDAYKCDMKDMDNFEEE